MTTWLPTDLTDYAERFDLLVELGSRVRAIRTADGPVELDDRAYGADQVVVATGPFQAPFVPPIAVDLDPSVVRLHSSDYRATQDVPDGPVLAVGGGTPTTGD